MVHAITIPTSGKNEIPCYSTLSAAGADVKLYEDVILPKKSLSVWIDLQLGFDIPEGYAIILEPRSSTSRKWGVICDTGVIDSDYKHQSIHCTLINFTNKKVVIPKGTRVVQLLVVAVHNVTNWQHATKIRDSKTGSGSTGD